jgi:glucose/arabinose dehydrogenase
MVWGASTTRLFVTEQGGDLRVVDGDKLLGKILRTNSDGSIPGDNPFAGSLTGNSQYIWAYGLRNPFTFGVQPGTGRIFLNDVGQVTYEEINDRVGGKNYGWPTAEGPANPPNAAFTGPLSAGTSSRISAAAGSVSSTRGTGTRSPASRRRPARRSIWTSGRTGRCTTSRTEPGSAGSASRRPRP